MKNEVKGTQNSDAKVILTIRDDASWIKSWNVLNNQILKSFTFRFLAKIPHTSFSLQKDIHNEMILGPKGAFKGSKTDIEKKRMFNEWNKSVIEAERILVKEYGLAKKQEIYLANSFIKKPTLLWNQNQKN